MFKCLMESDLECSLFSSYFVHKHYLPDFVSYFPVSVLASMHAFAVCFESSVSAWVVFNADRSLEIYIKINK